MWHFWWDFFFFRVLEEKRKSNMLLETSRNEWPRPPKMPLVAEDPKGWCGKAMGGDGRGCLRTVGLRV